MGPTYVFSTFFVDTYMYLSHICVSSCHMSHECECDFHAVLQYTFIKKIKFEKIKVPGSSIFTC